MRLLGAIAGLALTGLSAMLAFAFYDSYWRWRDCFNELGRCFDPVSGVVYHEQSGAIWGGLALLSLLAGLALLLPPMLRRPPPPQPPTGR